MSERAYSLELKKDISAKEASKLSSTGELKNQRAFQCCDTDCQISMTCTNWKKKDGKRYFFRPSSQGALHVIGCDELSKDQTKKQDKLESSRAKRSIQNNGSIRIVKSVGKAKSNDKSNLITKKSSNKQNNTNNRLNPNLNNNNNNTKNETSNICSIASLVELFLNCEVPTVIIENETIKLNELFLKSKSNEFPNDCIRIFYGEAKLRTSDFGNGMLEIEFIDSKLPKIYSNISSVSKNKSTSNLKDFLDQDINATVYYRGKLIQKSAKFKSFNDFIFKDIYF
ncbi:hypothetical protein GKC56_06140 [Neisseriaceae bacterium PsAf]|nr:hypothetical protein [Neisseriaceae bacterium PsAf]